MKKIISILLVLVVSGSAVAEMREWVFKRGKRLQAEFVAQSGGQISLKTARGDTIKIPEARLSEEDLRYVDLLQPPKLDLSLKKTSTHRVYPPVYNNSDRPTQNHYTFKARINQRSSRIYHQALYVELFIIAEENYGGKGVLYYYGREEFTLPEGTRSAYELKTPPVTTTEYTLNGLLRGEGYKGYMIIVTDSRGEMIASKATRDEWLALADNLRKLPMGKTFDENGERTTPTRPPKFY